MATARAQKQTKPSFAWASGFILRGDPGKAANRLHRIYKRHGELSAEAVREDALNPKSPLHQEFEWDKDVCYERWTIRQAQSIIRAIRFIGDDGQTRRVYAHKQIEKRVHVYMPVSVLLSNEEDRAALLRSAVRGIRAWQARFEDFRTVLPQLFKAIDEEVTQVELENASV